MVKAFIITTSDIILSDVLSITIDDDGFNVLTADDIDVPTFVSFEEFESFGVLKIVKKV